MHPTSPHCHSVHLQYVYLNPAAPRHFQVSRYLPQCIFDFAKQPVQTPPALPVPCFLCVRTVWGPIGRRGCICKCRPPHLPPYAMLLEAPSGMASHQTTNKRPKKSQAPAVYSLPPAFPLLSAPPSPRRCRGLDCRGLGLGFPGHRGTLLNREALLGADNLADV